MRFPEQPPELKLFPMEERLIAQRIPCMQIGSHPMGHQTFVWGNIVNVPVDIASTVNTLPCNLSDTETITIKIQKEERVQEVWVSGKCETNSYMESLTLSYEGECILLRS